MADHAESADHAVTTSVVGFHDNLEATLGDHEPMCLAMIRVHPGDRRQHRLDEFDEGATAASDDVIAAVQTRLSTQSRGYDMMARIDTRTFVLVVRTLADARVLDSRMFQLYNRLSEPYDIDGIELSVPVALGAAVRLPAEHARDLIGRAEKALSAAETAGGKAPVLI